MVELRKIIAKYCNFGVTFDTMLCDRLIFGVRNNCIEGKFLAESEFTLKKALEVSLVNGRNF